MPQNTSEPSEPQTPCEPSPPEPPSEIPLQGNNSQSPTNSHPPLAAAPLGPAHHRQGAIARLPKEVRWRINQMLDDGLAYRQIIQRLGDHGKDLNDDMVHRWKTGGYQDYLREQRLLDQCAARRDRAFALLAQNGHIHGFQATQQIASAQICEVVAELGGDILREALIANPLNYFRMLNSFSRLTNGGLKCERHLADELLRAPDTQPLAPAPSTKKGISPESVVEMQDKLSLM